MRLGAGELENGDWLRLCPKNSIGYLDKTKNDGLSYCLRFYSGRHELYSV